MNISRLLYKLDRILAWVLYGLFILMMISGYMITRGFLDYRLGIFIHNMFDVPTMALLSIHVAINVRKALMRAGVRDNSLLNLITLLIGLVPFIIILYLDFLYIYLSL